MVTKAVGPSLVSGAVHQTTESERRVGGRSSSGVTKNRG